MAIYKKNDEDTIELVSEIQSVDSLIATRDPICDTKITLLTSDCSKNVLEALNNPAPPAPPIEDVINSVQTSTKSKESK